MSSVTLARYSCRCAALMPKNTNTPAYIAHAIAISIPTATSVVGIRWRVARTNAVMTAAGHSAGQMASTNAHWELSALGEQLAAAQAQVTEAEESWLALAAEAESIGVTP